MPHLHQIYHTSVLSYSKYRGANENIPSFQIRCNYFTAHKVTEKHSNARCKLQRRTSHKRHMKKSLKEQQRKHRKRKNINSIGNRFTDSEAKNNYNYALKSLHSTAKKCAENCTVALVSRHA